MRIPIVLLVAAALGACATPAPAPPARPVDLSVEGALNRMPSLAAAGSRVVIVWTATTGDVMDVYAATSEDAGTTFSAPRRVNDTPGGVSSNAEQPPRVALDGDRVTVIWPSWGEDARTIRMARSSDGGRSFGAAETLHEPGLTGLRGWQSLAAGAGDAVHAVWLDGRHAAPSAGHRHRHHGGGAASANEPPPPAPRQDLYGAVITNGSIVETHIAQDVCFCCKTAVAVADSGRVFVAWRHIFPESIRDIALATSTDGGRTFGPLVRVSEDNWKLTGCPDDGPAIAVGETGMVHLAWPTFVEGDHPRKAVFYTSSTDGRSFAPRIRLSGESSDDAGHPQVAVDGAGNVAAAWDEQDGEARRIVLRIAEEGSGTFEPARILTPDSSGFHPAIVGLPRGFLVAWPQGGGSASAIRVQRLVP